MRWIVWLAASSAALTLLLSCKTSDPKPKTQQTAEKERKTTPISKGDEAAVRQAAEKFLFALRAQDFDGMWAMIADESRQRVGIANFVKQNSYSEKGSMISTRVVSVDGLGPGRALVRTLIDFQWAPSVFGPGNTTPATFDWKEEWVRQADGQWYRIIPPPDLKRQKEAEEMCANALKRRANQFPK